MLYFLFLDYFYLSGCCSSDEECSEAHSYLENDKLHPQELKLLLEKPAEAEATVAEAKVMNVKMI